jgi:malate dehydrogenase (oxaloacetate-decarboxylating)(NADP+)
MDSGVATRPIKDWDAYLQGLNEFVYHSGLIMKPVFSQAKAGAQAHRLCRRRGRARAARGAGHRRRRHRPPDPDRPSGRDRGKLEAAGLRIRRGTTSRSSMPTAANSSMRHISTSSGRPITA